MPRAHVDLRYEHEVRATPAEATIVAPPLLDGRGLVARLRALKLLLDPERDGVAAWLVAPNLVAS